MPNAFSVPSIRSVRSVGILLPGFGGGGGGPAVPFQSVNADGWSVTYASPPTFAPDVSPVSFPVSRQGWDNTGTATTHVDNLILTKRVRQPYPNHASLSTDRVSLSDYIYSTDTVAGATNNSAETSPAPVAQWALTDRRLVGDLLELEITAWHRNARDGKQVACCTVTVTDGAAGSVSQTVAAPTVSTNPGDCHSVQTWKFAIDISTLATGQITANGKIFGWIGGASATVDSATNGTTQGTRDFCPQIFTKNTALLAARPRLYIDAAGNDTTGYVGTNDASAAAAPCATLNGAIVRARTVLGVGACDGLIMFLRTGTWELTATIAAGNLLTNHEMLITRDPSVSRANAIYGFGTGNYSHRIQWLRVEDVTFLRGGTFSPQSAVASSKLILKNLDFNNASHNAQLGGNAGLSIYIEGGVTITNGVSSLLAAGTSEIRLVRGLTYGTAATTPNVEGWCVLGCELKNAIFARGTRSQSGAIVAFNRDMEVSLSDVVGFGNANDFTGAAFGNNVIEYISATTAASFKASADSGTGNITHFICVNNTFLGADLAGRGNLFYDDGPLANLRTHKLLSMRGNIHVQINYKSDIFAGTVPGLADASSRVNTWAYCHGVGCFGEFSMYVDANGGSGSFKQDYPGIGSLIGTSATVRQDPLFTTYAGTGKSGAVYSAGAGGGSYVLQSGSPCQGIVPSAALMFDLAGNPRPTTADTAGAYVL